MQQLNARIQELDSRTLHVEDKLMELKRLSDLSISGSLILQRSVKIEREKVKTLVKERDLLGKQLDDERKRNMDLVRHIIELSGLRDVWPNVADRGVQVSSRIASISLAPPFHC